MSENGICHNYIHKFLGGGNLNTCSPPQLIRVDLKRSSFILAVLVCQETRRGNLANILCCDDSKGSYHSLYAATVTMLTGREFVPHSKGGGAGGDDAWLNTLSFKFYGTAFESELCRVF